MQQSYGLWVLKIPFRWLVCGQEPCCEPAGGLGWAQLVGLGEEEHGVNGMVISFAGLIGGLQIRVRLFYLGTASRGHAEGGGGVGTLKYKPLCLF